MALSSAALLAVAGSAQAQTAVSLGTAESFAVLGAEEVTNTGPTVVNGDLGVSPGSAITGFPPGIVNGTIHAGDAVAAMAQGGARAAFIALAAQPCDADLTGQDLGGLTLTSGVYCFSSSAQLTGTLTLDAEGDPDAVFIFKTGSTLTTASGSDVVLINGAQACNVFWQIGSSATLGTDTTFVGNVIAEASITATTGTTVSGRLLALTGAVTLDSNVITRATCDDDVIPGDGDDDGTPGGGDDDGTPGDGDDDGTPGDGDDDGTPGDGDDDGTPGDGDDDGTPGGGDDDGTPGGGDDDGTPGDGDDDGTPGGGDDDGAPGDGDGKGHEGKGQEGKGHDGKDQDDKGHQDKGHQDEGHQDEGHQDNQQHHKTS
ncbi:ice-binding family protein [Pseudonocardia humida]|uniref:ice-binding family protein n=1 Tax=Pseudonocardia humida TaxID=2800819 RepID=UPI00207D6270|nr:ice-binding family protein [Pseudonocardia humida]